MRLGRLLGLALVAILSIGTVAMAQLGPGGSFTDDDGNVHESAIEAIAAEGITRGCNPPANDRFCPDDPVTRGQMAAFLVRALNITDDDDDDDFDDTDDSIFEDEIEALAAAGITRGCNPPDNTRFCPDEFVTRGQMAAFLVRALGYTDAGAGDYFVDDDASVFETDIDRLRVAGVTFGCNPPDNTRFCPDEQVTRGQMASFLARALELQLVEPPPPSTTTPPGGDDCEFGAVTIGDDLEVPAGETCTLTGTNVEGNILVRSGSTLVASAVDVDGNIQAEAHASVRVDSSSSVDGDIQADDGGAVTVTGTEVGGNVQLFGNDGRLTILDNDVDGDIQLENNTGGAEIRDNTVGGNLQCESNDPDPTGGNNTVEGDKEGECAGL